MSDIERWPGDAEGRSRATAWRDLVFTVATAPGDSVAEQTRASLDRISKNLAEAGADDTRLLSATVYLTDIAHKAEMDAEWCEWIGGPEHWPQRACVQAALQTINGLFGACVQIPGTGMIANNYMLNYDIEKMYTFLILDI